MLEYQNKNTCKKGDTGVAVVPMKTDQEEIPERRRPVLRQALRPILQLMKTFGLYYNDSSGKHVIRNKLIKYYAYVMNLIIFGLLVRSISAFWFVDNGSNGYYLLAIYVIFSGKTLGQTLYILYLSNKKILWNFIKELEEFLEEITLCKCRFVENNFLGIVRKWLLFFVVFTVFVTASNISMKFIPSNELELFLEYSLLPFSTENGTVVFVQKIVFDFILMAGWFLPVALCGTLMQTLHYTIHEYYRFLEKKGCNNKGLCVKGSIKTIRLKFLKLSSLASSLDGMVNFLLMISFLGDMMLVCLILNIGMYTFHGFYSRIFIFSWLLPPMFSLLYLSKQASHLHDKGQEMFSIVQFFNTDHANIAVKMEFDMLLFHLNTEPVVMTIWKMIPLYRSIIISIFVSIVTYFALIISLA